MPDCMLKARESGSSLDVPLHVQTRARINRIIGIHDGALKLKIVAPPVDNAANKAILRFFSDLLEIPVSRLTIVSGEKSRDKFLRIEGFSLSRFLSRLPSNLL